MSFSRACYWSASLAGFALLSSGSSLLAQERPEQPPRRTPPEQGQVPPAPGQQGQEAAPVVRVGQPVPDVSLPDLEGQVHILREHIQRGEVVVLEWVDPSTLHAGRHHAEGQPFHQIYARFRDQKVIFMAVCAFGTSHDAPLDHAEHGASGQSGQRQVAPGEAEPQPSTMSREQAVQLCREAKQRHGIEYPILLDEGGRVAQRFGMTHVPHVLYIDNTGTLVFSGPAEKPVAAGLTDGTNHFAVALQQVLNGERVTVPQRDPEGTTLPAGTRRADDSRTPRPQPQEQPVKWTCPMHPEVVRDAAGACPICNMALEQKAPE